MKYTLTDRLMWHFMQGTCYKVIRVECPEWDFHQPFTRKFQESMMKRSERENRIDSPYNWQAHYQLGKVDEEFTLSYTRCGLCELARKRGHLDILPAMCRTDYITFEAMGAILHRNKTLASGDDCCLYYMTKPGSEAERRWQDEHPDGTFINK